ncbi:MAG: heavy metal translocating P-type ATPase [Alphaproteobacteria bacterium]
MPYYRFPVEGLTCGHCAQKVEAALSKVEGVSEAVVNLSAAKAYVTTDYDIPFEILQKEVAETDCKLLREDEAITRTSVSESPYFKSTIISGIFILTAAIIAFVFPTYAKWAFLASALAALVPVLQQAIKSFQTKDFLGMNVLISLAVFGAIFLEQYLEGALVVFLYNLGQVLEFFATSRARKGISQLARLAPDISYKLTVDGVLAIPSENIEIGDVIELRPGDRLAVDGQAITTGEIDESAITGESLPKSIYEGDSLAAGVIGIGSPIRLKATSTSNKSSLTRIQNLVEEANSRKAPIARQIDAFASIYTPLVVVIAVLTALVPPLLFGQDWQSWIYAGLGLLLISCPCGLVLSTPTVIATSLSIAAREGILVKSAATVEFLSKVKTMAFDKTGTLTKGELHVTDIYTYGGNNKEDILDTAIQIEQSNNHPLAEAIRNYAGEDIQLKDIENVVNHTGKGVSATYNGDEVAVYSAKAAQGIDPEFSDDASVIGSKVVVMKNNKAMGMIVLQDTLRSESAAAMEALKKMDVNPIMLTGDNKATAEKIAAELNIDVAYELLPDDKLKTIAKLKSKGKTAMVGDGINDTPALSEADIGIAMGAGTDVALEVADAALSQNNINHIPFMIKLSQASKLKITQNIAFALGIKFFVVIISYLIPLGYLDSMPIIKDNYLLLAVLADTGVTVLVTLNALQLLMIRKDRLLKAK